MNTIALCGTFEVENYGDRLFSIIAERELSQRLPSLQLQLYTPTNANCEAGIKTLHPDHHSLFEGNETLRGIVIGGGDLISFSSDISKQYEKQWSSSISAHSACWVLPVIRRPPHVPLIWNAPGVPYAFTEEQALLVKLLTDEVDYLCVRDEISASYLKDAGVEKEIKIVPDTAFSLSKHFKKEDLRPLAEKIYDKIQLPLGKAMIFQMQPVTSRRMLNEVAKTLKHLSSMMNAPILLLPIGYCHEDHHILSELRASSKGSFKLVEERMDCQQTAAVIAYGGYFIGSSLHGNITAYVYGVSQLVYNYSNLAKLKGFVQMIQEEEREILNIEEALEKRHLFGKKHPCCHVNYLSQRVEAHFDYLVSVLECKHSSGLTFREKAVLKNHLKSLHQLQSTQRKLENLQSSLAWALANRFDRIARKIPYLTMLKKNFFD